jgi:HlyD family secretion protein
LLVVAVIAIAVASAFVLRTVFASRIPSNILVLSGRIEGDESSVAAKVSGRVAEVHVREGDVVRAGDTLAVLDDQQVRAREERARVAVAGAEAREKAAEAQLAVLAAQRRESGLQREQALDDASGRVRQAAADLAASEADLAQQQAAYRLASFDRDAYTQLAKSGSVSERQSREAIATADRQLAAVTAAQRHVDAARGALATAKANESNAPIRGAQAIAIEKQMAQQRAEIANANAVAQQMRAELQEATADMRDLVIAAPFNGTVMTRAVEPGEVITAGTTILTLLDLRTVYLRGYVPEGSIGRVKIDQPAHVFLDSAPKRAVGATVSRIDPAATFTPENTYFRDDRVKQVVGVKLRLEDATGFAKPGMPADGEILNEGAQRPAGWRK